MLSEQKVCHCNLACVKREDLSLCWLGSGLTQLLKYFECALCLFMHCLRIQSQASAKCYLIQVNVALFILDFVFSVLQLNKRTDVYVVALEQPCD